MKSATRVRPPRKRRPYTPGTVVSSWKKRPVGGDFDERVIGLRIDVARGVAGLEVKQLCDLMGWNKSEYTRKVVNAQTALWPGEASKLKKILKKPTGWPYIDEAVGLLIDAHPRNTSEEIARLNALIDELRAQIAAAAEKLREVPLPPPPPKKPSSKRGKA